MLNWLKLFFELQYRLGKPRWDTGVTPPEVVKMIEGGKIRSGRALDLGCGTGTNSIYLARNGFEVVGVDFSPKAISYAKKKAAAAGVRVEFHVSDVTQLNFLNEPFGFALDLGCFHGLGSGQRKAYAKELARLTSAGAIYMLYAFSPNTSMLRNVGVTEEEVKQTFAAEFALERLEQGADRGEITSAWYWFRRKS